MSTQYEEFEIDLGILLVDMWKGIKKFWFLMILILLIGMAGMIGYRKYGHVPMYAANATFTVKTSRTGITNELDTVYGFYYDQNTAEQIGATFPYILESDVFKSRLKEELGTDYIGGSISVSVIENSNLVTLRVVSTDPENSRKILAAVMEVYPEIVQYVIGKNHFELMDMSQPGDTPINSPNYKSAGIKGLLIGFGADIILALIYALTRKTIRTQEDLRGALNRTCLAVLPQLKQKPIITRLTGNALNYSESVYSLQNRLEFLLKNGDQKVLLVTSTIPGEGKTTLSLNLAIAMAQRDMKVLLIDGDFRNPQLGKYMGIEQPKHTTLDVLRGAVALEDAAQYLKEFSLYYLDNRKKFHNSVSVIQSRQMKRLMTEARAFADVVIIDTPPCGMLADAAVFCEYADSLLMVVRQDWTSASDIMDAVTDLPGRGDKLIGCVLNMVKTGFDGYGYGHSWYGSGYTKYNHYRGRFYSNGPSSAEDSGQK